MQRYFTVAQVVNPDTDSTVGAVLYDTQTKAFVPCRLGATDPMTKYVDTTQLENLPVWGIMGDIRVGTTPDERIAVVAKTSDGERYFCYRACRMYTVTLADIERLIHTHKLGTDIISNAIFIEGTSERSAYLRLKKGTLPVYEEQPDRQRLFLLVEESCDDDGSWTETYTAYVDVNKAKKAFQARGAALKKEYFGYECDVYKTGPSNSQVFSGSAQGVTCCIELSNPDSAETIILSIREVALVV